MNRLRSTYLSCLNEFIDEVDRMMTVVGLSHHLSYTVGADTVIWTTTFKGGKVILEKLKPHEDFIYFSEFKLRKYRWYVSNFSGCLFFSPVTAWTRLQRIYMKMHQLRMHSRRQMSNKTVTSEWTATDSWANSEKAFLWLIVKYITTTTIILSSFTCR